MQDWANAGWIRAEGCAGINTFSRFIIPVTRVPDRVYTLRLSVDTQYAVTVNGALFFGQYADYPFDKVSDDLNLTPVLKNGENTVFVDCWHQGEDTATGRGEDAGLIFVLLEDGLPIAVSGGDTVSRRLTRYAAGTTVPLITSQLGRGFDYDARKSECAPTRTIEIEKPLPTRTRPIRKLTLSDDVPATLLHQGIFMERPWENIGERMQNAYVALSPDRTKHALPSETGVTLHAEEGDGLFVLIDTMRENAGIFSLDIDLREDTEILIGWGEHLDDLRLRTSVGGRNFASRYVAPAGRSTFLHPFRRLGLRYIQLHIYARDAVLHYAGIRATDYPLSHEIAFSCADQLHTRIDEVSRRTLRMCMHEHYEDCPWREQALYAMDSRNQMLCGYYAFKETAFARASLRLLAESIRDDDQLELTSPARMPITIPSFTAVFLTQVNEYLVHSGDLDFARSILPTLTRIANGFIGRIDSRTGLIPCFTEERYWNFYEWQDGLSGSIQGSVAPEDVTYDAPLNAFVSFGLRALSQILDALKVPAQAARYMRLHKNLNAAIDRAFWNEAKGAYASFMNLTGETYHYAELTNALIVYADAADNERQAKVLSRLAEGSLLPVTLSHTVFKYDALMRDADKYARTVFQDIAKQWGAMLYDGATTFYETQRGADDFGFAGSLCHGWSAVPILFYHKYALELDSRVTGLYECRTTVI